MAQMETTQQDPSNTIARISRPGASEDWLTLHYDVQFADGRQETLYFPVGRLPFMISLFLSFRAMAKRAGITLISSGQPTSREG